MSATTIMLLAVIVLGGVPSVIDKFRERKAWRKLDKQYQADQEAEYEEFLKWKAQQQNNTASRQ